jgi:hypothetical protein
MLMKVDFVYNNPVKTANYLCFLAKNITRGLYQKGDFYVLPHPEKLNIRTVYFPDLNYSKDFWKKIRDCKSINLGESFPKECVEEVASKLPSKESLGVQKIINSWRLKESEFFKTTDMLFVGSFKNIKSIEVLLTPYGTLGSYYLKGGRLTVTHRTDINPDDIGRKILYLLVKLSNRKNAEIGEPEWLNRKAIISYLLRNTKLKKILPGAKSTSPQKKESELKRESDKYLERLGFNYKNNLVKISQWGKITIADQDINELFTRQEEYVVRILARNRGKIVGFSEFDKVPSLYALSKIIENIRKKISNIGINTEVITTVRGKGYQIN